MRFNTFGIILNDINKGLIYGVRYSELDFTVPEFEGFIARLDEYVAWKKERKKNK